MICKNLKEEGCIYLKTIALLQNNSIAFLEETKKNHEQTSEMPQNWPRFNMFIAGYLNPLQC
jgi:hypothetical protein